MASSTETSAPDTVRPRTTPRTLWRVVTGTFRACNDNRVTGLAGEAAFFAILSLPPLIFGLAGSIGYVVGIFGEEAVAAVRAEIVALARVALTEESIRNVIVPSLDAVLEGGRFELVSVGFLGALWSGSRALNVFIGAIVLMYDMEGVRGIVRTRALSFALYVIGLALGVVVLPLVLAGPSIVDQLLPDRLAVLAWLYWPTLIVLSSVFLATLYHLAVPEREPWRFCLPGAVLALLIWIAGGFLLRWVLAHIVGGVSLYGPLAAPIVVLLWLYVISISILIGAAFNAAVDRVVVRRPADFVAAQAGTKERSKT